MKKYAITDNRIPKSAKEGLAAQGFSIISLPPFDLLDEPVSAHPDMLMFFADKLICHEDYFKIAEKELSEIAKIKRIEIKLSTEPIGKKYPSDVLFNAAEIGDNIICSIDSISEHIKNYAKKHSKRLINVKQGYSKCSVCKVSDNAIITSDKGILKAAERAGIDTLEVSPSGILLNGYNCGFIGGATGNDGKNTYFCGNVELHPNAHEIIDFCNAHGAPAISLSDEPLYDVGTIFFI